MTQRKVAVITGSGKHRIGNSVAHALAQRGYDVAVHYHRSAKEAQDTVKELESHGVRAVAFQADLARESEVDQLISEVMTAFGRINVLVTAAAIWEPKRLEDVQAADVQRHFEINTLGTFLCCLRVGLIMAKQPEGGSIITMGDWATERPYPNYASYFVSKGSISTLTRTLAVELAQRNPAVRVNCIAPGPVMVPDNVSQHEVKGVIAGTLVKRLGQPENVAQAVVFLVENDYVTGICLPVDGGRTVAGGT